MNENINLFDEIKMVLGALSDYCMWQGCASRNPPEFLMIQIIQFQFSESQPETDRYKLGNTASRLGHAVSER